MHSTRWSTVSNVSHELKTPLTSMKVLADSLVGQQGVPEELYQEFMSDITAEIDRENKIITDLLSLVKMDKKAADVNITHMDINQLLEDILKRLRPIADRRNIDLILDCFRPVDADVDEVKFTLAVSNLVENGIKYNVKRPLGKVNPARVISFGAENTTFFYQKKEWISGRDMYYIDTRNIDEYACLFITSCLQPIAQKYSYNYGMFPNLLKEESIKLPANASGAPDYEYMEKYMKEVESKSYNVIRCLGVV